MVGGVASATVTVCVQTKGVHPEQVTVLWIVYAPQVVPEVTVTDEPVLEPEIVAPLVLLIRVQL